MKREELFARLRELSRLMDREKSNLLLYHGEQLDAFFSRYDFGDEGDERYMPCRLHYFDSLPVAYVLAGHFHNRFAVWPLKGGGCFVYPGSPVAVTRREKGCRKANLLVLGEPPRELVLDTLYYEEMELELDPFAEADPAALLQERLERLPPRAKVLLTVKGFINGSALKTGEAELVKTFKRLAGPRWRGGSSSSGISGRSWKTSFPGIQGKTAAEGLSPKRAEPSRSWLSGPLWMCFSHEDQGVCPLELRPPEGRRRRVLGSFNLFTVPMKRGRP